jgi:hypothetical protein
MYDGYTSKDNYTGSGSCILSFRVIRRVGKVSPKISRGLLISILWSQLTYFFEMNHNRKSGFRAVPSYNSWIAKPGERGSRRRCSGLLSDIYLGTCGHACYRPSRRIGSTCDNAMRENVRKSRIKFSELFNDASLCASRRTETTLTHRRSRGSSFTESYWIACSSITITFQMAFQIRELSCLLSSLIFMSLGRQD